jgi:hypothetical protein
MLHAACVLWFWQAWFKLFVCCSQTHGFVSVCCFDYVVCENILPSHTQDFVYMLFRLCVCLSNSENKKKNHNRHGAFLYIDWVCMPEWISFHSFSTFMFVHKGINTSALIVSIITHLSSSQNISLGPHTLLAFAAYSTAKLA